MVSARKPQKVTGNADLRCSFCHKSQREVRKLIASPMGGKAKTYICDECVRVFRKAIDEKESSAETKDTA